MKKERKKKEKLEFFFDWIDFKQDHTYCLEKKFMSIEFKENQSS